MRKELFWLCYLLVMAAIVLLPVFRNVYSLLRYKMTFPKHDKHIIAAFCKNSTCVYVSKFGVIIYISVAILLPVCIFLIHSILFPVYKKHDIILYIVAFILHVSVIMTYINCLYEKHVITNTALLIRSINTKCIFVTVQLNDILQYKPFSYIDFPFYFIDGDKSLSITTKDNKKFILVDIKNRDEFVATLKMFTDSTKAGEE